MTGGKSIERAAGPDMGQRIPALGKKTPDSERFLETQTGLPLLCRMSSTAVGLSAGVGIIPLPEHCSWTVCLVLHSGGLADWPDSGEAGGEAGGRTGELLRVGGGSGTR